MSNKLEELMNTAKINELLHLERDYLDDFDADDFGDNFDDDFIEFSDTTPEAED